jgi:hypothetical protein
LVRRDLDGTAHAILHVADKQMTRNPVALSNAMRENKFRVGINRGPQPKVPARTAKGVGKKLREWARDRLLSSSD